MGATHFRFKSTGCGGGNTSDHRCGRRPIYVGSGSRPVKFSSYERCSSDRSKKMKKLVGPLLLSTAVVSGCATTGGSSLSRPTTAALECGAGGAGAALLICKLAGGSDAICAAATGGAALVGAGACYGVASHYEQRRKELAGKEQNVDALLSFAKANNADAEK